MLQDPVKRTIVAVSILFSLTPCAIAAEQLKEVSLSITVKAKPRAVWDAIRSQRKTDKAHRKLISYHDGEAVIEEQFPALPVIGAATCLYKETEVPLQRIDYAMIQSDQFKQFEGSWVIEPVEDGNSTQISLSSRLDPGLRIPFWKEITRAATAKHLKDRLSAVRHDAEESEQRIETAGLLPSKAIP